MTKSLKIFSICYDYSKMKVGMRSYGMVSLCNPDINNHRQQVAAGTKVGGSVARSQEPRSAGKIGNHGGPKEWEQEL